MGGLFGNGVKSNDPPVYTCLQIQTSAQGLPIPILWGANRISGNCIDYFNFTKVDSNKGKGGKGGKTANYTYYASVILALCEGSATGTEITLGRMWVGASETDLAGFGGGIFPGTATQAAWPTAAANPPNHPDNYAYTCYYAHADLDLGSSATLPNINFELFSTFNGNNVTSGLPDANMGDIIVDFLTNHRYTLNFPITKMTGFNDGGTLTSSNTSLLVYHYAAGLFYSPILKDAEQVTSILQRWATVGNFWVFWSGTQLKCIPLGDTELTAVGPHGENVQYIPNVTPIYDLGPDDFVTSDKNSNKGEAPVKVTRKDPADGYNQVQLNCSIRTTNGGGVDTPAYQDTPYRWQDAASIDHVGVQAPNVISSTEICLESTAAAVVSLIGQRAQYIRNDYEFKLPFTFFLLEPGDIVTLTDPNIGLVKVPVRIKQVDEDDKDVLSFTAEEFAQGTGTANIQEFEPNQGNAPFNTQVAPGSVNTPAFFQPPLALTGGVSQVWVALSAGGDAGGAGVFLSFDETNFSQIGEVETSSLQGTLTANLPEASGLDTTNTLAIDLTESLGVIPTTATEADAQAFRTLCLVDDELIAYGSVVPTGDYTANLTYLERGVYGTAPAAHTAGARFARLDPTKVFAYTLPQQYIGVPLYFDFPTVNIFGNNAQTLAECTTYEFTPSNLLPPTGMTISYQYNSVGAFTGIQVAWTNPTGAQPTGYNFRWSLYPSGTSGQTYGTASLGTFGSSFFITAADLASGDGYLYVSMQATAGTAASPWTGDVSLGTPTISSITTETDSGGHLTSIQVLYTPPTPVPNAYYVTWYDGGSVGAATVPPAVAIYTIPASSFLATFTDVPASYDIGLQFIYGFDYSERTVGTMNVFPPLLATNPGGAFLAATNPTSGSVKVDWSGWTGLANQVATDGALIPTHFEVFCWPTVAGTPVTNSGLLSTSTTNYTFSGLTPGTNYTFAMVTYNASGTAEVFVSGKTTLSATVAETA